MNTLYQKILIALIIGTVAWIATGSVGSGLIFGVITLTAFWVPVYMRYIQDNPKHYWFKRKLFGWGWSPATWQGWVSILLYIGFVALLATKLNKISTGKEVVLNFTVPVILLTIILIFVAYKTGEKPRWQWGKDINKYTK